MRNALLAALALTFAACAPFEPDDEACGLLIRWNGTEPDVDALCAAKAACEADLGIDFEGGAWVDVVESSPCGEGTGGCYDGHVIYVVPVADWSLSSLCHELVHRHLDASGDPDGDHSRAIWKRVEEHSAKQFERYFERLAAERAAAAGE